MEMGHLAAAVVEIVPWIGRTPARKDATQWRIASDMSQMELSELDVSLESKNLGQSMVLYYFNQFGSHRSQPSRIG